MTMSPERSGSPMSPQAVTPRGITLTENVDNGNVQEAEQPRSEANVTPPVTGNDDDLTSLTWLQDRNLLKGMNLSKSEPDELSSTYVIGCAGGEGMQMQIKKETIEYIQMHPSPTSDYVDESSTSAADSSSSSLNSPVPTSYNSGSSNLTMFTPRNKHPNNIPYDPKIHTSSKPPYSFSCLIFMAIENSEQKALPVKEIYAWILEHFPYFKNAPTGWKNSVRHNLSLNKCFQKVEKAPNLGKGSLWMVDQQFRPNLLQALTRSPFHPCSILDANTLSPTKSPIPSSPSSIQSDTNSPKSSSSSLTRLPNPDLFPYLSRRLAASEIKSEANNNASDDSLDDMDAANVMLALKHGPRLLKEQRRRKSSLRVMNPLELVQVITTSPSEDHTYSAANSQQQQRGDAAGSPDEAFESDDSQTHSEFSLKDYQFPPMDLEEQRRIAEGADALLNLAGITTLRKRTYSDSQNNHNHNHMKRINYQKQTSPQHSGPLVHEYEKPTQFRPRLLRSKRKPDVQKRKLLTSSSSSSSSSNAVLTTNNYLRNDWIRYRKAMDGSVTGR